MQDSTPLVLLAWFYVVFTDNEVHKIIFLQCCLNHLRGQLGNA